MSNSEENISDLKEELLDLYRSFRKEKNESRYLMECDAISSIVEDEKAHQLYQISDNVRRKISSGLFPGINPLEGKWLPAVLEPPEATFDESYIYKMVAYLVCEIRDGKNREATEATEAIKSAIVDQVYIGTGIHLKDMSIHDMIKDLIDRILSLEREVEELKKPFEDIDIDLIGSDVRGMLSSLIRRMGK